MIFSNCPRCDSNRIRRGYQRTPWWSAIIGRYNLHCVKCNWEFPGFAVPGTVSYKIAERRKKTARGETDVDLLQQEKPAVETFETTPRVLAESEDSVESEVAESDELIQTETASAENEDSHSFNTTEVAVLTNEIGEETETKVAVEEPKRRRNKRKTRVKLQK